MGIGHWLTGRLVAAAAAAPEEVDEALVLDLAGAALAAGASVPGTLQALGRALDDEALEVVGRALLLGADWDEAWRAGRGGADAAMDGVQEDIGVDGATGPRRRWWNRAESRAGVRHARLEACLRPGWEDGASPAPLLAGTAASLRAGRQAADAEAAERLAVRLVLPLGTCFLPAFIILGIVPVVMSVGMDMLAG
ncbi:type II secretion protein F [Actinomyces ruminis]|uniref:type II secretion protein F n=1 Tax=Actinomyces ruminis TaxID=1937003 RepID=UPI00211F4145|nr:type II secretion protein F [Actinomyces ruminis]